MASGTVRAQSPAPWLFAGADIYDSRANLSPGGPQQLNLVTAPTLAVKWTFDTAGPVVATPTVEPGGLYVADYSGMLYKLDPDTGALIWSHPTTYYTGATGAGNVSRNSPAIGAQNEIVVGDSASGTVFAVNRTTGALIWKAIVDDNASSLVRGSAVIYKGVVYIGVTSGQEGQAKLSATYTPDFRGSVVALDETTGQGLWKYYTVPAGYTGAGVWNRQPVVFPPANALIFATGNNYSIPAGVAACVLNSASTPALQATLGAKCLDPNDQVDALVSVDLTTGKLNWSRRVQGPDTYNGACEAGFSSCPDPTGYDFDFASAPNLVPVPGFVGVRDDRGGVSNYYLLGAGQKSGIYWAINPYSGGLFWSTPIGNGEIQWGTAIDTDSNGRAFVALNNYLKVSTVLVGANGAKQPWNASSWASVNLTTGKLAWQVPAYGADLTNPTSGSSAPGAISYSNHVGFAGSSSGYMVAFDCSDGGTLWSFNTGAPVVSAPAIFNDTLYWGAGTAGASTGKLYAFSIASATASALSH